jgi:hypothetical protein
MFGRHGDTPHAAMTLVCTFPFVDSYAVDKKELSGLERIAVIAPLVPQD